MKQVFVTQEAQIDIERLIEWYNAKQLHLGQEFLAVYDEKMDFLARNPGIGSLVRGDDLRVIMPRFPVNIYYRNLDKIYIRAVFHHKIDVSG